MTIYSIGMPQNRPIVLFTRLLLTILSIGIPGDIRGSFAPNRNDYSAYGSKIAMNEVLLVEAQNEHNPPTFFIQFSPYNDSQLLSQCSIQFPNLLDSYVYSVALGKKQKQKHFFFAGELINDQEGAFIGLAKYNSLSVSSNTSINMQTRCELSFTYSIEYFNDYSHQEHYLIDVEPKGLLAYGFSNDFLFMFDARNITEFDRWNGNITWPDDSFIPYGVDIGSYFGVIAGFVRTSKESFIRYTPIIYLLNFSPPNQYPIIVDQYEPTTNRGTWQALLTNSDANVYSAKYTMSIDINDAGEVLVGMQFINRVFLFSVNRAKPANLIYISRSTYGRSLGNGRAVAWLDDGLAAILVNTYTLNYEWLSSRVHLYDIRTSRYNSTTIPLSMFPNTYQLLPQSMSLVLIHLITSPTCLAILDERGNLLIVAPTRSGFYPLVQETGSKILFTTPQTCPPGTAKNRTGLQACSLCPTGFKNPGNCTIKCVPCSTDSLCSLGASDELPTSVLVNKVQAVPYPKSPESTTFDEILMDKMFSIRFGRCLVISPLFWIFILGCFALMIIIIMTILKFYGKHPTSKAVRKNLKRVLKRLDLINEGELWLGGLASFAVLLMVSFALIFSLQFFRQYPVETSSTFDFVCDQSILNAKFDTNIQSLAIPFPSSEQQIADLLNEQEFDLNIHLINTLIDCDAVSIQAQVGLIWTTLRWLTCTNSHSILSLTIPLPYQHISIQIVLADTKTIGALRIGLYGAKNTNKYSTLRELNFYKTFFKNGSLLAQNVPIVLEMTKVINETLPMTGDDSQFAGIYIPTFRVDLYSAFLSEDQYIRSNSTSTTLNVMINETPFYVKNIQQPVAKQFEIIFHNILFFIVCLELFGLIFLSYKLVVRPILSIVLAKLLTFENTIK